MHTDEVTIPWVVGTSGPRHYISGYQGGGPCRESYGVPAARLRAAGWVPAREAENITNCAFLAENLAKRIKAYHYTEQSLWEWADAVLAAPLSNEVTSDG